MAKDRPWNRQSAAQPGGKAELAPEDVLAPVAGDELRTMTDAEVRAHCLKVARISLATYEQTRPFNADSLEHAVKYAVIAEAFRPDPAHRQE